MKFWKVTHHGNYAGGLTVVKAENAEDALKIATDIVSASGQPVWPKYVDEIVIPEGDGVLASETWAE